MLISKEKRDRWQFILIVALLAITLFTLVSENTFGTEKFKTQEEEDLYQKGITFRDQDNMTMAIECFRPLAEKYTRAKHNLAMCYFKHGDETNAYIWFSQASEQGLVQSTRNLKKMNLLYLLLPNELLSHVVSFFTMQDIAHFNLVSRRAHRVITSTITTTNFLTSKNPYAVQFLSFFNEVEIVPKPKQLRLVQFAKVTKGSIEVHFRDSKHLRHIVEETPLIRAKGRVYFVRNQTTQDGDEIVPTKGRLERNYFLNFFCRWPTKG